MRGVVEDELMSLLPCEGELAEALGVGPRLLRAWAALGLEPEDAEVAGELGPNRRLSGWPPPTSGLEEDEPASRFLREVAPFR